MEQLLFLKIVNIILAIIFVRRHLLGILVLNLVLSSLSSFLHYLLIRNRRERNNFANSLFDIIMNAQKQLFSQLLQCLSSKSFILTSQEIKETICRSLVSICSHSQSVKISSGCRLFERCHLVFARMITKHFSSSSIKARKHPATNILLINN